MKANILLFLAICFVCMICNVVGYSNGEEYGSKGYYEPKIDLRGLKYDFYHESCPHAEDIVRYVTQKHVLINPYLPAKLLRMHFHDCFVNGCDASVLLNSTTNVPAERDAIPNLSLEGFDVIDEIKAELEKVCYQTVSCADIVALSARDAVSVQYGKPLWEVPTGRRDGTESLASKALSLPSPFADFTSLKNQFYSMQLSVLDLVALSGGHTIGIGHCNLIRKRLYNFTGKGDQDPSLNYHYALFLKTKCPNNPNDSTTTVEMDPGSSLSFDNHYFGALVNKQGLFQSDTALLTNAESRAYVYAFLNPNYFLEKFAISMLKMGTIDVLTGTQGQIRKHCAYVN